MNVPCRRLLTEAIYKADASNDLGINGMSWDELIDWLMPAVLSIARQRGAYELRTAANECGRAEPGIAQWLRDRAAEIYGEYES